MVQKTFGFTKMINVVVFVTFFCLIQCGEGKFVSKLGTRGFTSQERQRIVDLHNMFRSRVATGKQSGQPKAANMIALEWDDRLEKSAQSWSDTCPDAAHAHSDLESRRFYPYLFTGQNFAGSATAEIDASVADWYGEVKYYTYDSNKCHECSDPPACKRTVTCAHYTQTIWSVTTKVGCGQNRCDRQRGKFGGVLYCEYAPIGNGPILNGIVPRPYVEGTPCSQCPAGYSFCLAGSLCASERACVGNSKCKCTLKAELCKHGDFEPTNCMCRCKPGYEGKNCDVACQDELPKQDCDLRKDAGWCKWNHLGISRMETDCRKTCSICGTMVDEGQSNRANIKTEVKTLKLELPTQDVNKYRKIVRGNCRNKHGDDKQCNDWARRGQCESNPGGMIAHCASSCNKCEEAKIRENEINERPKPVPIQRGDCENVREDKTCDDLAKNGACSRDADRMKELCASSCNTCPGPSACEDRMEASKCQRYKSHGYCSAPEQQELMTYHCAETCRKC
ncbi:uncharacterized protein LOC141907730 [Tubulanus polymorphus]|uniref:uncharacterized protein LOC141907730 n=1 Tax=Tubulanus polymorphus TaxID=672921 RepID=UPI003DA5BC11